MDGWTDGRTYGWMDGGREGGRKRWMDGNRWMDGWMGGHTDGWMETRILQRCTGYLECVYITSVTKNEQQ